MGGAEMKRFLRWLLSQTSEPKEIQKQQKALANAMLCCMI